MFLLNVENLHLKAFTALQIVWDMMNTN